MQSTEIDEIYKEMEDRGQIAPKGECKYCDKERENLSLVFPSHKAYEFCKSYLGGKNHCTCDTCF